ncbi:hypothetical protein D9615_005186 [Tricholomella constricta]|uniref:peptidyl-tRNA hydrolase n=1 Tax=Tricholomella constricta TaxID=117010 RepID=A0A8H5M1R3_9AGAR|nr:hypothetical protein D9615_005186 [Tricholomella constricta]
MNPSSSNPTGQATAYAALIAVSLFVGYWAGVKSRPSANEPVPTSKRSVTGTELSGNESDSGGSDTSSTTGDCDIASLKVDQADECKLVLVVRTDLGMTPGKIAAQ